MGQAVSGLWQLIEMFKKPPRHDPETVSRAELQAVEEAARAGQVGIKDVGADVRARQAVREFLDLKKKDRENYPRPSYLVPYRKHVNVAITGESGTGKSSLLNAILERKAAETGIVECTMSASRYDMSAGGVLEGKIHFWDLPGVGTMKFPADRYIREMGMRYFDAVLLVLHNRVKETNVEVVRELNKHRVPVLVVVNKMDDIMESAAADDGWGVDETFAYIREQHLDNFAGNGCQDVELFLLSTRCIKNLPMDAPMNQDWGRFRETLLMGVQECRSYVAETDVID